MNQTDIYASRILKSLTHIEEHLDEELSLDALAKVACYSPFHFHRLFQAIVGESVHGYIKRLRLEKAAVKLRNTGLPVTQIALDACYETPSSFTKAFKEWMGNPPQAYRALFAAAGQLKELPPITPDRIENIPDMPLLFLRRKGGYGTSPWEAWDAMIQFVHDNRLDRSSLRYFSVLRDDPSITDEDKVRFDACILAPSNVKEQGEVGRATLQGGKYALFTHRGPYEQIEDAFDRIYFTWLPDTRYTVDDACRPPFCEQNNMHLYSTDPENLLTKIYIPVMQC